MRYAFYLAVFPALLFAGMTLNIESIMADETDLPPGVTNTQAVDDHPLSPSEALAKMKMPKGFQATLFAAEPDVQQPIACCFDDRGRLWVLENYSYPKWQESGHDRILIFEDTNGDGVHDSRKVFWDKGNYSSALQVGFGGVWVGNTPNLLFIPDSNGDDKPDGEAEIVLEGFSRKSAANVINNLNWGPDGWLYGSIGSNSPSHVGIPGSPLEGRPQLSRGVWRYHPTRKTFEVVARGTVNPWGLDWNNRGEAFFVSCVVDHLWHLVPGAYYPRKGNERDNPFVYETIGSTCDHLHWAGGNWTDSRGGHGEHGEKGGGHAHTGLMIYAGGNWPSEYHQHLFMNNIHGHRINHDVLERRGAGYVGKHRPDFLHANDEWFRALSLKYGPDGGVTMIDWQDFGECHDNDGVHRSSGRIYKVTYGKIDHTGSIDLGGESSKKLAEYQKHENEWYARHARRLLQERAAAGSELQDARGVLLGLLETDDETVDLTVRLRALWCLNAINSPASEDKSSEAFLLQLTKDGNEHVRAWAVRLLCDAVPLTNETNDSDSKVSTDTITRLREMATDDDSQLVRLYLASVLPRLANDDRWEVAFALAAHAEDSDDREIPLMIWYGIEPLIKQSERQAIKLIAAAKIPLLRKLAARRLAEK